MPNTQVVLLTNGSVLGAGIHRLLQEAAGLDLVVVETNDPNAESKVRQAAPQVIVLDAGDSSIGDGVITRLLSHHPKARVIALTLSHTGIEVYRMKRVSQADPGELLAAIQGRRARARAQPCGNEHITEGRCLIDGGEAQGDRLTDAQ